MKKAMKNPSTRTSGNAFSRREFVAGGAAVGVTMLLPGFVAAAPTGAKTFTILHTNDLHSNFLGLGYGSFAVGPGFHVEKPEGGPR
jgi:5'-nucleotidase